MALVGASISGVGLVPALPELDDEVRKPGAFVRRILSCLACDASRLCEVYWVHLMMQSYRIGGWLWSLAPLVRGSCQGHLPILRQLLQHESTRAVPVPDNCKRIHSILI